MDIAADLWSELKRYISVPDRSEAADLLINLLIDNDYNAEEIKTAFKGDTDVRRALQSYLDDSAGEIEEEDDDELFGLDDDHDRY
jgi:hypothetical protein